jgi:tetratricopeptide (TPR) repeat protein
VLAIYPNHMEALANKGLALGNLGRYQEAIEYFDQAIAIIPDATETLNNKANALTELQQNIEPAV